MKIVALAFVLGLGLSSCTSSTGAEMCVAAGGQCVLGGFRCPNAGPQDCNPDRNPGGGFCCLPCPGGTKANDAGTACE